MKTVDEWNLLRKNKKFRTAYIESYFVIPSASCIISIICMNIVGFGIVLDSLKFWIAYFVLFVGFLILICFLESDRVHRNLKFLRSFEVKK